MSLESAVVTLLKNDTNVTTAVASRIYPDFAPVDFAAPCLVYLRTGAVRVNAASGSIGMVSASVQISCWAKDYATALLLAGYVRVALDGYSGTPIGSGTAIDVIRLDSESDTPLLEPGNEQMSEFGITQDYTIWYRE